MLALIATAFAGQAQAAAGRVEFAIGPATVVGTDGRTRPAGTIGAPITGTGYTLQSAISGLKELLRVKFNFDAGDSADASIHFFLSAPSWRPYA
jgi:hypothetical protein